MSLMLKAFPTSVALRASAFDARSGQRGEGAQEYRAEPRSIISARAEVQDIGNQRVFLSTVAPSRRDWLLAATIALLSLLAFVAIAPFAKVQLPVVPAFIPAYESALLINDLITAILLFGQFGILRSRALLVLAGGYLFSGLMAVPHALTFPGVFAPQGLLGAGTQTTAWIYISWHNLFPLVVIAYALLKQGQRVIAAESARAAIIGTALAAVCAVTGLTLAAILAEPVLPPIMSGIHYAPMAVFSLAMAGTVSLLSLVVLWIRRPHTLLDVWMMVVMCAWLFDVGLSSAFNNGRYDLGFYAGRIYVMLGASFVLAVMLVETTRLYARLAGAAKRVTDYAATLEAGVRTRTIELQRSNEALTSEISERKQAETHLVQAQKMEAIGNLTGGMAHDFNNLLGIIIGNLDLLRDRQSGDPDAHELTGEALDAALRGADLTRRLLAFARRQPLQPERADVNELIAGIVKLLERTLGEQIQITLDLNPDTWPVVVDPAQLESSLTNLATNARDAMPGGGQLIIGTGNRSLDADYASQHAEVQPGDYALIEVSDSGAGMAPEVATRIFEPFYTTKEPGKGTGLGLSMVFGFIKQSGGHINVYSEVGIGTIFRLYLRRADAGADAAGAVLPAAPPRGSGETVLAVEDNASLRRVVVRQLTELGYRVLEAEDVQTALRVLESEPVDLLFTDIVLPGGTSGYELARTALSRWPAIKIVLTSGFPEQKIAGDANAPNLRLLSKPYRRDELGRILRDVLDS